MTVQYYVQGVSAVTVQYYVQDVSAVTVQYVVQGVFAVTVQYVVQGVSAGCLRVVEGEDIEEYENRGDGVEKQERICALPCCPGDNTC